MLPDIKKPKKLIYLDHAATTPVDWRVKKAMEPFWHDRFGNPSAIYGLGSNAAQAIEEARADIAKLIGARTEEIIFTAGGTESINLAIFGIAQHILTAPSLPPGGRHLPQGGRRGGKVHLITSKIEHHAVLNSYKALEEAGCLVSYLSVDKNGFINFEELKKSIRPETVLISVMYGNNEIGTIEPIAEIGKWLRQINTDRIHNGLTRIFFHTDACQAAGALDINVQNLGVDLMSVNGSKLYGPKQTGFLYVKSGTPLKPLIFGGGQERGLRSGTENVPGIIGLATALELAQKDPAQENKRLRLLRDYFITALQKKIPGIIVNGPDDRLLLKVKPDKLFRLPNNINFTIPGIEGETLMLYLDSYGVCVSTGSACTTGLADPSHVLIAIGKTEAEAKSSIRITLGKFTTKQQLNYTLKVLTGIIGELRKVTNQN